MTTPFTYYLFHRPTGKKYYGVKYGKGCKPEHLWTRYYTSSKKVKSLIQQYGTNSFDVQVRKVFDDPKKAIDWETRVLRKINVLERDDWLNGNICGGIIMTDDICKKVSDKAKARPINWNAVRAMNAATRGITRSEYTRSLMSKARSRTWLVTQPDGQQLFVDNLFQFCKAHDLDQGTMSKLGRTKGYSVTRLVRVKVVLEEVV